MSNFRRCDGCGRELGTLGKPRRVIHGERVPKMMGGGGLPAGEFDWCERCAQIAFSAVEVAAVAECQRVAIDGGQAIPR